MYLIFWLLLFTTATTGYSSNLQGRLIQNYNVTSRVARRLARAYGGRAVEVIHIAKQLAEEKQAELERLRASGALTSPAVSTDDEHLRMNLSPDEQLAREFAGPEVLLVPDYPFIEAEVIFAVRHDWAVRPEDFLARRTRLAFLNKDAAMRAIPRVVQLMAQELKWDHAKQSAEMHRCVEFMRHFGGSKPTNAKDAQVRLATRADLFDAFRKAKATTDMGLNRDTLQLASEMLDHILSEEETQDCLTYAQSFVSERANGSTKSAHTQSVAPEGMVTFEAFASWWNSERLNEGLSQLKESKKASMDQVQGSGTMFG